MNIIARPMPSPTLQRELPRDVIPFWPALVQQYDRVCHARLLDLALCDTGVTTRPVEAQQAQEALPVLAQARRSATVSLVYLELAQVAAHMKLGDVGQARAQLQAIAATPLLDASLAAPARPSFALVVGAHPLWLVMHVAIEAGVGPDIVADVFACGLRRRVALEPELAAGLLLNALKWGDIETLQRLQAEGLVLTPRAQSILYMETHRFAAILADRANRGVALQAKEDRYLRERRRALVALGEGASAQRLHQAQSLPRGHCDPWPMRAWRRFSLAPSRQGPAISPPQRTAASGDLRARRSNM